MAGQQGEAKRRLSVYYSKGGSGQFPVRVRKGRFSKASRPAAPERIAAEPAIQWQFTPGSSRSWAGLQPAEKCQERKSRPAIPSMREGCPARTV